MDELLPHNDPHDEPIADEAATWDQPLLAEDLEAAYLRALEATDAIEREIDAESDEPTSDAVTSTADTASAATTETGTALGDGSLDNAASTATATSESASEPEAPRVSEKQVVEAALFVGGTPLTAKKLGSLFHTEHEFGFVECLLDELNRQYADEGRPYTIALGEEIGRAHV